MYNYVVYISRFKDLISSNAAGCCAKNMINESFFYAILLFQT